MPHGSETCLYEIIQTTFDHTGAKATFAEIIRDESGRPVRATVGFTEEHHVVEDLAKTGADAVNCNPAIARASVIHGYVTKSGKLAFPVDDTDEVIASIVPPVEKEIDPNTISILEELQDL